MGNDFAMPSTFPTPVPDLHVAIIMDGNGRWAVERGLPRSAGHRAGVEVVRRVVEAAPALGVSVLTLYAFSAANWRRPPGEVRELMSLLREYLCSQTVQCVARGVRLSVIGRRDRLPAPLAAAIVATEAATCGGRTLHLRLALDYSARDVILRAARSGAAAGTLTLPVFERLLAEAEGGSAPVPPVDLLIRPGGEQRLSDFLLWESAFAELVFTDTLWPDFGAADLDTAVRAFRRRERRFGGLPKRLPNRPPNPSEGDLPGELPGRAAS
jgi:undecaprenyl diphosphate synthase